MSGQEKKPRKRCVPVPPDAFARYVALGPGRSYELVGKEVGCTGRAIAMAAEREGWQQRLAEIEADQRVRLQDVLTETLADMNLRHVQTAREVQVRAMEALKQMPIASPTDAAKILLKAIEVERLVRGEPTDRVTVSAQDFLRELHRECIRQAQPPAVGEDSPHGLITTTARPVPPPPAPPLPPTPPPGSLEGAA